MVEIEHTRHVADQGMGASIAVGVAATANAQGWLILPADLPLIQPDTIRRVALALADHDVVVPMVQAQRGHPVGFSAVCKSDLLALQGDEGARRVISRYTPYIIQTDDIGCTLDVDTPDALKQIQQRFSSSSND